MDFLVKKEEEKEPGQLNLLERFRSKLRDQVELSREEIRNIIKRPEQGPIGRFQKAVLDTMTKLRFQRKVKHLMKGKVEAYKSYFLLNLQKIFLYEMKRPKPRVVHHHEWDYVMVFPNPDVAQEHDEMTEEEAGEHFDSCVRPDDADTQIEQRIAKKSERKAYLKVFRDLPDYLEGKKGDIPKKARFKGGRFFRDQDGKWHDRYESPGDVQTLMMNLINRKLSVALGLHTKGLLSSDGKYILLLISADEEDIMIGAEKNEYNVQMELGWCDLYSIQPCDRNYYPFLSLIKNQSEIEEMEEDLKEYFEEVMGVGDDDEEEGDDEKIPSGHIQPFEWEIYKKYLENVKASYSVLQKARITRDNHHRGLFLKKLTRRALAEANQWGAQNFRGARSIKRCCQKQTTPHLKHLWQWMGEKKEIGPFSDYTRVIENGQDKYAHLWRRHMVSETGERSIFREIDRLKILDTMIQRKLVVRKLMNCGYLVDYFPVHNDWIRNGKMRFVPGQDGAPPSHPDSLKQTAYDENEAPHKRTGLEEKWKYRCCNPFYNPTNKIRSYFGEKIAFYFEFITFYSKFLFWTGFIGFVVLILQYVGDSKDQVRMTVIVSNAVYMLVAVLWSTFFYEYWKRKQNRFSIAWGQTDFQEDEVMRPSYYGTRRRSPQDDDMNEVYFPTSKRNCRRGFGYIVSLLIVAIVIVIVFGIFYLRYYLTERYKPADGEKPSLFYRNISTICSTINAIQIVIFNTIYNKVALTLTKWENHRTQSDFESSLISKTFMFQFVNSFNSMFYIAFIKRWLEGCVEKGGVRSKDSYCQGELRTQLTIIFIVAIVKNLTEIGVPILKKWLKERRLRNQRDQYLDMTHDERVRFRLESEFILGKYESLEVDGTYSDYIEMMVQFGYVILFAIGFPMAPVLAMLNNIIEVQVDKYKLMKLTKRPIPHSANGIGVWAMIIDIVTTISIFTNMGVFCFTMSTFKDVDDISVRFYVFIALAIFFMCLRYLVSYAIPDISENMALVKRRHSYLIEKSLKGFIKSKPRSILPEKSNFTVLFTKREKADIAGFGFGNLFAEESPEKPAMSGAFTKGLSSERSGLLAGVMPSDKPPSVRSTQQQYEIAEEPSHLSDGEMPTVGDEEPAKDLPQEGEGVHHPEQD